MLGSLSDLCGHMLVVGLEGPHVSASEARALRTGERGGVILFRRNIAASGSSAMRAVAELVSEVTRTSASRAELPPLVAIDQEGGRVMRLGPPAMQLPPMRTLGDLGDDDLVRRLAEAQARELAALGITMSFAPVADIHTRHDNPIIGDRAFASTPGGAARFAGAFAEGLGRGGVLPCAKHFPGHGDTTVDSHLALPRVERAREGLEQIELAPFAALAKSAAVDAMMTAHVVYPSLDPDNPATLSRSICTELLRGRLGFMGALFSDDLEMKALTMGIREAAVRAVLAGCDVLLVCSRADLGDAAHEALVHEAERSPTFRARCEEASARALALRRRVRPAPITNQADLDRVFAASAPVTAELARRLEAAS